MKVLSVVGARPQFVKAAVLSREFAKRGVDEWLVHTGQHYDERMSDVFFTELELPAPRYNLGVGSALHGEQTAQIMSRLEPTALEIRPDWLLVYGDTNSTLAGALVGAKLHIPVAHVEAGLRSFDRRMPEEINRLVADRVSDLLLAPTENAAEQLRREGLDRPIAVVGDLMVDLAIEAVRSLPPRPAVLDRFELRERAYALATIHRAGNTDDPAVFERLIEGLRGIGFPVVFPVHPRTLPLVNRMGVGRNDGIVVCEPLSYLEMLALQAHARVVVTDSGGVQKEAFVVGTPCVTLREQTEWIETLEGNWNVLAGDDPQRIIDAARRPIPERAGLAAFGTGDSSRRIVDAMFDYETLVAEQAKSCAFSS